MEKKKKNPRLYIMTAVTLLIFMGLIARLFDWQIINGASYRTIAAKSTGYTEKTEAVRGEILDINGKPLAVNITGYKIVISKLYLETGTENQVISRLLDLMASRGEKWIDNLPITVTGSGGYEFIKGKEDEIERLKSKQLLNMNPYSTAQQCMEKMIERYEVQEFSNKKESRDIVSVRYNMEANGYGMSTPYTFADAISQEMVAVVSENCQNIRGVTVATSTIRVNENSSLAPHIIGAMGALSQEEYSELKDKGYKLNDRIGKFGIEAALEEYLRGTEGSKIVERTSDGAVINTIETKNAKPGNTVYLTLDANLQTVANKALKENIDAARQYGKEQCAETGRKNLGEDCNTGAVVMLNVKDFSVMAAATYPSYDLTKYLTDGKYYSKLISNKNAPLFDRAINGSFAPGSIFKPAVAMAALQEGKITPYTGIDCTGSYNYYPTDPVKCMKTIGHGVISLKSALTESCNVYFAEVGKRLGINPLYLYAQRFGLGEKTGLEIPESSGTLAGRDSESWQEGNTVRAAIGQADNAFTPVQLATYAATIANDGGRLKTHLVSKIVDYSRKKTIFENSPENPQLVESVGVSDENIKTVQEAMRNVVESEYGTAHSVFGDYGIAVAAKTGTAETDSGSDHTTFICYAPYDNPEVAVAVVLEHGAKGKFSMGVAKALLDKYFESRLPAEENN